MLSTEMRFRSKCMKALLSSNRTEYAKQLREGVEETIHNTFFEGNNRVVCNGDAFRAYLGAAFRDVAQPDALQFLQIAEAILHIEWVHFECGRVHQKSGADELALHVMVAEHMAHVLAEVALDAFP